MLSSDSVQVDATASCDWLTRTFSNPKIRGFVYDDWQTATGILTAEGHEPSSWCWMGYEGMSIGGLSWGHREDTDILRASGGTAERMFDRFAHYQGNCSRIDIALTLKWPRPQLHTASKAYQKVTGGVESDKRRTYSLVINSRGGETLYVGSRSSNQFGRLYDKDAEEGLAHHARRWRYEVEFKADRAARVLELLQATRDRGKLYLGIVQGFFKPRGVSMPALADETLIRVEVVEPPKHVDTQLAWLRQQVAPVVGRLQRLGLEGAVVEALRLEGVQAHGSY